MQIQVIATPSDQTTISLAPAAKGHSPRSNAKQSGVLSAKVAATPVSVKEVSHHIIIISHHY